MSGNILHDPDHVANAKLALTDSQDSQSSRDLLEIWVDQIQKLEDVFWDLYQDLQLPNAYGKTLDLIGTKIGESRQSFADQFYFRLLRARVLANNSDGTPDTLLRIARLLTGALTLRYFELSGSGMRIEWIVLDGHTAAERARIASVMAIAKPLGMNLQLIEAMPSTFGFAGGDGLGYGVGVLATRIL